MLETEKLITIKQTAEMLDVSTETIRRWMRKGKIPTVRIGAYNRPRLRLIDVLNLVSEEKI